MAWRGLETTPRGKRGRSDGSFGGTTDPTKGMHSVGVDAIEIDRIDRMLKRFGKRFLSHVYTDNEVDFCRDRIPELAVRFAAKEAVSKALGTGLRGIAWREIEILPDRRGKPLVYLHGQAALRAAHLGLTEFAVSLTHCRELAIAFVVAE